MDLTGAIDNDSGGAALTAQIVQGTLALTGNNSNFNGSIRVHPDATLEARAQSLPPILTNNGLVLFNQPDVGSYAGTISGIGQVGKMGGGVLTLSGPTPTRARRIQDGTIAVGADNALGASIGNVILNGGALAFNNSFTIERPRVSGRRQGHAQRQCRRDRHADPGRFRRRSPDQGRGGHHRADQ